MEKQYLTKSLLSIFLLETLIEWKKKKCPPFVIIYLRLYPFFSWKPKKRQMNRKQKKREKCLPSELFCCLRAIVCCRERTEVSTDAKVLTVAEVLFFVCLYYNRTKQESKNYKNKWEIREKMPTFDYTLFFPGNPSNDNWIENKKGGKCLPSESFIVEEQRSDSF